MNIKNQETRSKTDPWGDRLVPVLHRIARRADEIWSEKGRVHGSDLECWLRAEREIIEQQDALLDPEDAKPGLVQL